jgi:integrase
MQKRIDAKAAEGKITAGNRLKANFSTFSKWLFQQGYSETDLSARLVKAGKERPREVVLSVEEVQAIWRALDGLSGPFASAFRLLILTGQRVSGPVWWISPPSLWCAAPLPWGVSTSVCG